MVSLIALALSVALTPIEPQARYEACLDAISDDAETAYETALAWRHQGGGWPAEHCVSVALIALGHVEPGALRLREAADSATASAMSRAIMYGQSGDAFLQAENFEQARVSFTAGLDLILNDAGLQAGLAQARLGLGDAVGAEAAASIALALNDQAVQARRLRAEARLRLGDYSGALRDVELARQLLPEDIELLVLRGRIREAQRTD